MGDTSQRLKPAQAVHALATRLADQVAGLTADAARRLNEQLPEYTAQIGSGGEDHVALARAGVEREILALSTIGTPLSRRVLTHATELGRKRAWEGFDLEPLTGELGIYRTVVVEALERLAGSGEGAAEALVLAERRLDALREELVLGLTRGFVAGRSEIFERDHRELEALVAITRGVNRSLEIHDVAEAALSETVKAMHLDGGALWLVREEGEPELASTHGLTRLEQSAVRERPFLDGGLVARALTAPGPVQGRLTLSRSEVSLGERSVLVTAVRFKGRPIAVMAVGSNRPRHFTQRELDFVTLVGEHVAVALEHAHQHRREARTDYLTGLANRAEFERAVEREVAAARRYGRPFSVLLIDLDQLKYINDTYGHQAGDSAIQAVGDIFRRHLRSSDTCARLGGDEFAAAMPDAGLSQAEDVAERIHNGLAELNRAGRFEFPIEVSAGLATWQAGLEARELLHQADQRLYRDKRKRAGRRGFPLR